MNRWTERFTSDGEKAIAIHDGSDFPDVCFEGEREYDVMNALAEYEDLEEQGLLVRLPCKVGDTVYVPKRVLVSEFKITAIFCDILGTFFYWLFCCGIYERTIGFSERDIGKTVFLTREEAEKKLEEMKKND